MILPYWFYIWIKWLLLFNGVAIMDGCVIKSVFINMDKTLINKKSFLLDIGRNHRLLDIIPIILIIAKTGFNEFLRLFRDLRFHRKIHWPRFQYHLLLEQLILGHIVAKWFLLVQHFIKNDPDGPNIHFSGNLGRLIVTDKKAFGRQVPIRTKNE